MAVNNVTHMLEAKNIPHDALEIPAEKLSALEVAEFLNLQPEVVYKTIIVKRASRGKPILALVPGPSSVDTKKIAAALKEKKIYVPTQREAEELTGLQVGGISPLALIHKGFQVLIDASAQELERVVVSAGQRGLQVRVGVQDLVELTGARFANIAG